MQNIKNFRPLAYSLINAQGKGIKKHMIFRSGELSKASIEEIDEIISLGIKSIFDLRSDYEQQAQMSNSNLKIYGYNISQSTSKKRMDAEFLKQLANSDVDQFMMSLYREYLALSPVLKPLFQHIIKIRTPFLFHCSAGKDRTGIIGAILMSLLDFDLESIYQEYLKIDFRILNDAIENQKKDGLSEEMIHKLIPLSGVNPIYLDEFFKTILSNYQTMNQYFYQFLDLTQDEIIEFKKILFNLIKTTSSDVVYFYVVLICV